MCIRDRWGPVGATEPQRTAQQRDDQCRAGHHTLHSDCDKGERLGSASRDDEDDAVRCAESDSSTGRPQSSQPDDRLSSEHDQARAAALSAGVGDASEPTLDTALPPPGSTNTAVDHHHQSSDRRPSRAVQQLCAASPPRVSDDVDGRADTDPTMASNDDAGPPRCAADDEASSGHVNDHVMREDKLSGSAAPPDDDDDVDRKLADELERLKSLTVTSPKTSTAVSRPTEYDFTSTAGLEETSTEDLDYDVSESSFNNNRHSRCSPCSDEDTGESALERVESESSCIGLHTDNRDSPSADLDVRPRTETVDDDDNEIVGSTDQSMESLHPAASAVEHLQELDPVSSREQSNASGGPEHSLTRDAMLARYMPVSYTHLTLPTILRV